MVNGIVISKHILLTLFGIVILTDVSAQLPDETDGAEIMRAVHENLHRSENVYEELTVIMTDEFGNRDTKQLRKYARISDNNVSNYLLVFDSPEEFNGVALLVSKQGKSIPFISLYLPAFGQMIRHSTLWEHGETLFGMDFSIRDLAGEILDDYHFVRRTDRKIENISYFVIDVFTAETGAESTTPIMQHFIHQENLTIARTDYFDRNGKIFKQLTVHDFDNLTENIRNAAMLLMEDRQKNHKTLIKVNKRIVSKDYVPEEVFTVNWLYQNHPPLDIEPPENDELETELIDASITVQEQSLVIMKSGLQ
jgi:hypothetical protein